MERERGKWEEGCGVLKLHGYEEAVTCLVKKPLLTIQETEVMPCLDTWVGVRGV